jgi:hypothetical protein
MTLREFTDKYTGGKHEFDGEFPYQCVDLIKFYNRDVVNGPSLSGHAYQYSRNEHPSHYRFDRNTPLYIPHRGSIAVFNQNVGGGFGHVSIVLSSHLMYFTSLDQNWPMGAETREVRHIYRHVVGFLVPVDHNSLSQYNGLRSALQRLLNDYPVLQA